MAFAIVGGDVLCEGAIVAGRAVIVECGRIRAVAAPSELPAGLERHEVEGLLAPGFIDVQVNGGGGVLFNDARTVAGIRAIGGAHRRFGTTGFLPTFMSDTRERIAEAVAAVREGLSEGIPGLLGIHLEGPFLNPERKGVHDARFMRPIEDEDIRIMTSLGAGRTLVTLAPEMVPPETISRLTQAGVIVSAGHTAAEPETLAEARRRGLTGYTHLFNAMPPLMGRAPGPVGAALADSDAFCSIIVDLHHVTALALRAALAARGTERTMVITDAMSPTGSGLESFELNGRTIYRRGGRLTTADGTLAGADLDMASAVRNSVEALGLPKADALRMASHVPATFLGLEREVGSIRAGLRANLVLLDAAMEVRRTWIDGVEAG